MSVPGPRFIQPLQAEIKPDDGDHQAERHQNHHHQIVRSWCHIASPPFTAKDRGAGIMLGKH